MRPRTYPAFVGTSLGKQRFHMDEFKAEAVALAQSSGQPIRRAALDLGITNETPGSWLRPAAIRPPGMPLGADERAELLELASF